MSVSGSCWLLVVGCRLSRADYVACRVSLSVIVVDSWLSVAGCLVVDSWLSVAGCLVVDCMCRFSGALLLIACFGCRWLFFVPGCRLSGA